MKLYQEKELNQKELISHVVEAKTFFERSRGLMFRSEWDENTAMWIHRCNSIHTGFMSFSIDAVFVNKKLVVKKIIRDLKPWRLVLPIFSADSVFEFASQNAKVNSLKIGDQLYVGH